MSLLCFAQKLARTTITANITTDVIDCLKAIFISYIEM